MSGPKTPRRQIDWPAVELQYRAGVRSLKDIGAEFGVSDAGIIKRAKVHEWTRDLKDRIKAKADAKVSAAVVSAEVSAERAANEQAVVEANAEVQYRVRMEHRTDIARTKGLFRSLLGELEVSTTAEGRSLMDDLIEVMTEPEDPEDAEAAKDGRQRAQKMRETLNKVLGISGRIDSAKRLTEILERLIGMERVAFGIDDAEKQGSDMDALLKRVNEQG